MDIKTREKCKNFEKSIFLSQFLTPSEITSSECYLNKNEFIYYTRIQKQKPTKDNILLMAHGYMGSNTTFFKMYGALKNDFHIISIDLPGQGLSSSVKVTPNSPEKWIEYFVSRIKAFLQKMKIKKVNICGHSLGAFVLTHFADKYPEMIGDIFLLSPGGVNNCNPDFDKKKIILKSKFNRVIKYIGQHYADQIFKFKLAPRDIWFLKWFPKQFTKRIYTGKRLQLSESNKNLFVNFYSTIYQSKPSSDKCLGYLFKEGPTSEVPLMKIFEKLHKNKNILLLYGQADWMDFGWTQKQVAKKNLRLHIDFVEGCEHQIVFQNPQLAVNMMLKEKKRWEKGDTQVKANNSGNVSELRFYI